MSEQSHHLGRLEDELGNTVVEVVVKPLKELENIFLPSRLVSW